MMQANLSSQGCKQAATKKLQVQLQAKAQKTYLKQQRNSSYSKPQAAADEVKGNDGKPVIENPGNITQYEYDRQEYIKMLNSEVERLREESNKGSMTKGQVTLIAIFLIAFLFALPGLLVQFLGYDENAANSTVSVVVCGTMLALWSLVYAGRVFTKNTTYNRQLKMYETEVMVKRLEEMDDKDIKDLYEDVTAEALRIEQEEADKASASQVPGGDVGVDLGGNDRLFYGGFFLFALTISLTQKLPFSELSEAQVKERERVQKILDEQREAELEKQKQLVTGVEGLPYSFEEGFDADKIKQSYRPPLKGE